MQNSDQNQIANLPYYYTETDPIRLLKRKKSTLLNKET
ncbi:MAG: hypothetical protein ACI8Q1_002988 [Parvicella sp.]